MLFLTLPNPQSVPYSPQSPDIGQTSEGSIFDFWIFGQSRIKINCFNSRTSDDTVMKLGPVTKRDRRYKATSKKIDDDFISENFDVITIFPVYGQFGAIRKPDSGGIVCKTYIFINSNLLPYIN